jgi:DNA-binding NtrC family response regulator
MALFSRSEWEFTENTIKLVTSNPFDPGYGGKAQTFLDRPSPEVVAWRPGAQLWGPRAVYTEELDRRVTEMTERLCRLLQRKVPASEEELARYESLSLYRLYHQYGEPMDRIIDAAVRGDQGSGVGAPTPEGERRRAVKTLWEDFQRQYEALFRFTHFDFPARYEPAHLFACFFLFRRAFYHIFFNIVGFSKPIAKLRSAIWESIVTHDLLGWAQGLHRRMKDIPTLITGPSGTGKERVAEAIARSQYIPFHPEKKAFEIDFPKSFNPVNLSAMSPSLIESELFGHVKGAFTGATANRAGRLEECPEQGAVFLDEVGELTEEVQVKLLRVLQSRRFQRVGANEDREFRGKIIAATNRDLAAEIRDGRFREDFYYRLCADQIVTPSLREQLRDRPEDLPGMVEFVCRWVVGEEKAAGLAREVVGWIGQHLRDYDWPGNFRELEQCVRSYTIRKKYHPLPQARPRADDGPPRPPCDPVKEACQALAAAVLQVKAACADEIELKKQRVFDRIKRRLFKLVSDGTRTKQEAAALLGIDVRTLDAGMKDTECLPVDGPLRTDSASVSPEGISSATASPS